MSNEPTGAQLVISTLKALGVETLFGYPGGAIMPIYDALAGSGLQHILVRHEQGAAFAADAYARATGRVGVCMATSGPGATNLITGIANAYMDSVPLVCITGQVSTHLMGTDGFQEVDILGICLPIVKHSWLVRDPADIPRILAEAFAIASEGRAGPVLVDIPKDVAAAKVGASSMATFPTWTPPAPDADAIREAEKLIAAAKKPLFYAGGGVEMAGASPAFLDLVKRTGIPVVTTLKGIGVVPTTEDLCLGMLGMHGTRAGNTAVQEADLLIALGARFDDRATGKLNAFAPNAKIIHADIDPAEINKLRKADVAIVGNLKTTIESLNPKVEGIQKWVEKCKADKWEHRFRYNAPGAGVYAPGLLKLLSEKAGDKFIAACDVGQHQMWVAQHCEFANCRAHLTSGGSGAMGYGLPAGVGAKLAKPDHHVVTISGDGSFMMNIQEMATLNRYNIPLKIVLLDNSSLGLVRQWQELFYQENYSEIDLSDNPDFVQVAKAFGIDAFRITHRHEVEGAVDRLLAAEGPTLLHVLIDPRENVWPLVPPGASNAEMMEERWDEPLDSY
ncbi:acetolactate synthase, large subunit, biosynthetic type [Asticcacaulis biprosthecium C19]|uniref:Acetolactate synthase n=1 Tax=Asticcacaulis biprosthecium C19 TaxID=715226 RepID=F4QMC7_9CAUL|nr:acetolactate synthase 2 catalytic subunit [Asticcacaulis biprosthecium]EGF91368.1 acetolactate synthase, large subunit, biosynthetic type [Asticcacaulis biprosthecium C19]